MPYWLDYAWLLGKGSPVIVLQTKRGQHGKKDLPIIRETYRQRLPLLDFQDVELKEDDWDENGLNALLLAIRRSVKRVKNKADIPANWVKLRQVLRDKQLAGDKSMTLQEYLDLPEAQDLADDPLNVLCNWLVKTGVVFYRKGMFQDAIILDQAWAIKAIYTIFDRDSFYYQTIQAHKGKFSGKEISKAWHSNSVDERELFLSFMLACELCFEIKEKEKDAYSHPHSRKGSLWHRSCWMKTNLPL
ncbi:MAG: hypothetical protein IPN33_07480 [Saprospiraceae bacterium]|nr:hypothetical protein [Saprospiraceae bacterium]